MRKKLLVLGSIFMLLGSFLLINRLQKSNFTIFNQVSEEQVESIKNTLQEEAELSFTALLCNEIRVPFDDATNTFYRNMLDAFIQYGMERGVEFINFGDIPKML